jgi:hypothetical protein
MIRAHRTRLRELGYRGARRLRVLHRMIRRSRCEVDVDTSVGGFIRQATAGLNSISFGGWLESQPAPLTPGEYRAVIVATDPQGNSSAPVVVPFTIVGPVTQTG